MDVKLISNLNKFIAEDTIQVLGQDGLNCGEWLDNFSIGDTLILGLDSIGYDYNGILNNWYLSGCDFNYLRVNNNMVDYSLDEENYNETLEEFQANLLNCIDYKLHTKSIEQEVFKIYPNPVNQQLNIEGAIHQILNVEIVGTNGMVYSRTKALDKSGVILLPEHLIPGVYFLRIQTTSGLIVKRLVKSSQ